MIGGAVLEFGPQAPAEFQAMSLLSLWCKIRSEQHIKGAMLNDVEAASWAVGTCLEWASKLYKFAHRLDGNSFEHSLSDELIRARDKFQKRDYPACYPVEFTVRTIQSVHFSELVVRIREELYVLWRRRTRQAALWALDGISILYMTFSLVEKLALLSVVELCASLLFLGAVPIDGRISSKPLWLVGKRGPEPITFTFMVWLEWCQSPV